MSYQVGQSTPEPIARAIDKTVFPEGMAWRNCLVALTQRVQAATDFALYIDFWDARTASCRVPFTGNETYEEARSRIDKAIADFLIWRG